MADVAPSFGIVGSVVGLIGMLAGIGDASVILATIPIALTSTLYGIILSSFVFTPFMSNIRERTLEELFLQKIITEGIVSIAEDIHPRLLERKLRSFLTPSARNLEMASMEKINLKFNPDEFEWAGLKRQKLPDLRPGKDSGIVWGKNRTGLQEVLPGPAPFSGRCPGTGWTRILFCLKKVCRTSPPRN